MRLTILVIILSLCFGLVTARESQDAVVLISGNVIYGIVVKNDELRQVTITAEDGSIYTIPYRDIKSINEEFKISQYLPGYMSVFRISLGLRSSALPMFSFSTVQGFRYKSAFALGIGLGVDEYSEGKAYPLFVHTRVYMSDRKYSSYLFMDAGYSFAITDYTTTYTYRGKFFEVGVGLISPTNSGLVWFIDGGIQRLWGRDYRTTDPTWKIPTEHKFNTITFSFGILFH